MLAILEPLKAMQSEYVFEGQKRHKPLSNMSMLMLLRRMRSEGVTVHGFRSTFRDWASEAAHAPREIAEMSLSHRIGSQVEHAYEAIKTAAQTGAQAVVAASPQFSIDPAKAPFEDRWPDEAADTHFFGTSWFCTKASNIF